MPRKLQPVRYAVTRICAKCGWRDETTVEQEAFAPAPDVAELEQGEWSCVNECGSEHSIEVQKLPPAWLKAFQ